MHKFSLLLLSIFAAQSIKAGAAAASHQDAQNHFIALERSVGIKTPKSKIDEIRRSGKGPRGTQMQMDAVRDELNELVGAEPLDVKTIHQKIEQFEAMNPGRWPRAEDYRRLLIAKLAAEKEEAAEGQPHK